MRVTPRMAAAMKGTRMRELRALGYTSDVFPAKYRGGKCGLSGLPIHIGDPVAFFRDFGLCHAAVISNTVAAEKRASMPKCGCGQPAEDGRDCCLRCSFEAEQWFDSFAVDVTRDSVPLSPEHDRCRV